MTTCPACQSVLDPAADCCPICLRRRSRQEMMRDFADEKKRELFRRRLPWLAAAGAALAVLAAWSGPAAFRAAAPVIGRRASAALDRAQAALERAEDPQTYAPSPAQPISASGPAPAKPAEPTSTPNPRPAAAAAPQPPARWLISGRVYDLLTLAPVPNARLAFKAPDGAVTRVATDRSGRYSASLAPLTEGGYALAVTRGRARANFLEEGFVPFAQEEPERRRDQARDAARAKVLHVPITVESSKSLVYNVALLPSRRK